jgi:Sulfotransferase family
VRGDLRVVYVGGLGRSGSTLLERLLGEIPGVSACGEIVHMWQRGIVDDELCGCGEAFSACDFWSQVGKSAFGGWNQVDLERLAELGQSLDRTRFIPSLARTRLPAQTRQDLADYTDYYVAVYQAIAAVSGCTTLVDSSKHASLAFCLARNPEIDLRVIHLVRDSRAVAFSWTTKVARPEGGADSYMTTYPPMSAAAHWNAQNGALQVLARRGTPVLRVRYEDLVSSPRAAITGLAQFAGLPGDDLDLTFLDADEDSRSAVRRTSHTVSGNPMRFSGERMVIRSDERWRTAMPRSQRRAVTALTFPLLAHYGYPWRTA